MRSGRLDAQINLFNCPLFKDALDRRSGDGPITDVNGSVSRYAGSTHASEHMAHGAQRPTAPPAAETRGAMCWTPAPSGANRNYGTANRAGEETIGSGEGLLSARVLVGRQLEDTEDMWMWRLN